LAAPAPLLRLGAGPMAGELLRSMNMRPEALLAQGFEFEDPDIDAIMAQLV
jgi:NAD dependent epimerase/dehydratase family enzyme